MLLCQLAEGGLKALRSLASAISGNSRASDLKVDDFNPEYAGKTNFCCRPDERPMMYGPRRLVF